MSTSSTEKILEKLRELKPLIKKRYRAGQIELFGSYIREEQNHRSDIDILVDFEDGADLFDLMGLAIFLEENLKQKVDVIPKRALRPEIREAILKEAVSV
jgi:hypothetical protein